MYLLDRGVGVSDGVAVKNTGALDLVFKGEAVDGVFVGGKLYPVTKGSTQIDTEGLSGVVNVTARNGATKKAYACDSLHFVDDLIVPMIHFTPAEYAEMASAAEAKVAELDQKVKILEEAVFGVPLFRKEG